MITNNKKRKEVRFHKVNTNNFNRAKKFYANKSSNEIKLKDNISPLTKRDKRDSIRSSIIENILKNVENKYCISVNKNLLKKTNKKIGSSNQVKSSQFKEIIQKKNIVKREKQKNIGAKKPLKLKQDENKQKEKNIPVNTHFKYCKTLDNNINRKKIYENDKISYVVHYNSNKTNRSKKSKKMKEVKEEKKNNDDTIEKEKTENLANTIKKKFCCCL